LDIKFISSNAIYHNTWLAILVIHGVLIMITLLSIIYASIKYANMGKMLICL